MAWGKSRAALTFAVHRAAAIVALVPDPQAVAVPDDPEVLEHEHHDLPPGHAHADGTGAKDHRTAPYPPYVVDDLHPRWPGLER